MAAAGLRKDESVTIVLLRFHYSTIFGHHLSRRASLTTVGPSFVSFYILESLETAVVQFTRL